MPATDPSPRWAAAAKAARKAFDPATAERIERLYDGLDAQRLFASFATPKPSWLFLTDRSHAQAKDDDAQRLETLRELIDAGAGPAEHVGIRGALRVGHEQREALTRSPPVVDGLAYIQGLASRLAVDALGAQPGERVLDLCAAPGGKTLRLAMDVAGPAGTASRVVAVEPSAGRRHKLLANLRRCGAHDVEVIGRDGRRLGDAHRAAYDRVLVDAPCSGEARWSIDPATPPPGAPPERFAYRPGRSRRLAAVQVALLRAAVNATRPGGVVVYTTCTLSPEENEAVVHKTLRKCAGAVSVASIDTEGWPHTRRSGLARWNDRTYEPSLAKAVRLAPDPEHDGMFCCRLRVADAAVAGV